MLIGRFSSRAILQEVFDGVGDGTGIAEGGTAPLEVVVDGGDIDQHRCDLGLRDRRPSCPPAMLATCVPCEPGCSCDWRSIHTAGGSPGSFAA